MPLREFAYNCCVRFPTLFERDHDIKIKEVLGLGRPIFDRLVRHRLSSCRFKLIVRGLIPKRTTFTLCTATHTPSITW